MVVSSRRQANVDKAVALLKSQSIQVTGTTCNVDKREDREKLVQMVSPQEKNHVKGQDFCNTAGIWNSFHQGHQWDLGRGCQSCQTFSLFLQNPVELCGLLH